MTKQRLCDVPPNLLEVELDPDAVRVGDEELAQAGAGNGVLDGLDAGRSEPRGRVLEVAPARGDVVDRRADPQAGTPSR